MYVLGSDHRDIGSDSYHLSTSPFPSSPRYDDGVFHVTAMGHPPAETSDATRAYFGAVDFFGGGAASAKKSAKLLAQERANPDAMFVLLSDVWLDRPAVMEGLKRLFSGYASMPPTAFVLMGNFLAAPYGAQQAKVGARKSL